MLQVKIFVGPVHGQQITMKGYQTYVPETLDEDINNYITEVLPELGARAVDVKFSVVQDQGCGDIVGVVLLIYEEPDEKDSE